MLLKKIEFENFRQFYGKQAIEFATGYKNVTIIFGENGKGKTGIFRGLIFSIFGDRYLGQDNTSDKLHLVNMKLLDEDAQGIGSARVTTVFEHDKKTYTISREMRALKEGNNIVEKEGDVKLEIVDENGNSMAPITSVEKVNDEINNVINKDVKDFFFFDGEKIETFAKTNRGVRKEVKNGIIKLLNIEDIDKSTELVAKLKGSEERRITNASANSNLKRLNDDIEDKEKHLEQLTIKEEENEKEETSCRNEIEKCEAKLLENNEIKDIQKRVEDIKAKEKAQKKLINSLAITLRERALKPLSPLLIENELEKVINYLENTLPKNESIADVAVLRKILSEQKCLCGTEVVEGNLAFETIENLIKNSKRSLSKELNRSISQVYEDIRRDKERVLSSYDETRREFRREKDELESVRQEKDREEERVKDLARTIENLSSIEDNLEVKKRDLIRLEKQGESIKVDTKVSEKELEKLRKELEASMKEDNSLRQDMKKLEKLKVLLESFKNLLDSYTEKMRSRLIEETTNMFKTLIDSKDEGLISKVGINENYELAFYNWNNVKITQDISQGQRQVVALSFITSLAKLASKDEEINFPLFMDTPFGRMSGNNRDNIIKNVPNLTSQWVPLLTDTELSRVEEGKFASYGKVGKKYRLEQIEPGKARIVEVDVNKEISKRS